MIHIASFSGGKDSTALLLWMKEQGIEHETIFCDTGWEHPITTAYIDKVDRELLGGRLIRLKSEKYTTGFHEMVIDRGIVPGMRSRFCTQELKIFPLHNWLQTLDDSERTVYQGIRSEESASRAASPKRTWENDAGGFWIDRPLKEWAAQDVFDIHKKHGIEPNPLYKLGAGRVGCWPCVMVSKRELACLFRESDDLIVKLEKLEADLNKGRAPEDRAAFFRSDYIPERFMHAPPIRTKDGRLVKCPTAREVRDYLMEADDKQLGMFEAPKCVSIYNLCE